MNEAGYNPAESKEKPKHYDLIIVLGNNMGRFRRPKMNERTKNVLSLESKIVALAAAILYKQNPETKLLISTGNTTGEEGWNL